MLNGGLWMVCFSNVRKLLILERETGLEPATSSLGSWHSTTELLPRSCQIGYLAEPTGLAGPRLQSIRSHGVRNLFQPTLYHRAGPFRPRSAWCPWRDAEKGHLASAPRWPQSASACKRVAPFPSRARQPRQPGERASCVVPCYHTQMGNISVEFSLEQLQALVVLANNQLFRVKYIDPKMPGHVNRPEQLEISKEAVQIVEAALNKAKGIKVKSA